MASRITLQLSVVLQSPERVPNQAIEDARLQLYKHLQLHRQFVRLDDMQLLDVEVERHWREP